MRSRTTNAGFTLIELMVAVLVAAILVSIAVPSYTAQVRKSRRTEAKTALMDLAGREERWFNGQNNAYTSLAVNLGYAATGATTDFATAQPVGSGYYQVTITPVAATGTTQATFVPAGYTIVATPLTTDQQKDTTCASFTLTSTGVQTSKNSASADSSSTCWK